MQTMPSAACDQFGTDVSGLTSTVPIEATANPAVTKPTTSRRRYTATVNNAISATPDAAVE